MQDNSTKKRDSAIKNEKSLGESSLGRKNGMREYLDLVSLPGFLDRELCFKKERVHSRFGSAPN
ncbi:hypothetical protein LEP1GSC061_0610 [Leptospira wolffii serovar Khorat str. Khorat-H2]|nr:hypothetical protein LEP1GSC061_0610 [Leptospira wolffii serovar Khorat str. Khorat-H2]